MASPSPNRRSGVADGTSNRPPERRVVPAGPPQTVTPDDVVPRLVELGVSVAAAEPVARAYPEQRITDALDALDELDSTRRVVDPIGWVDAAIKQRWDLTGLLGQRRAREQRLDTLDTQRRQRETAREPFPAWRLDVRCLQTILDQLAPGSRSPDPQQAAVKWIDGTCAISDGRRVRLIRQPDLQTLLESSLDLIAQDLLDPHAALTAIHDLLQRHNPDL